MLAEAPVLIPAVSDKETDDEHDHVNGTDLTKRRKLDSDPEEHVEDNGTRSKGQSCHQCKSRRSFTALSECKSQLDSAGKRCRKMYCGTCLVKFYELPMPETEAEKAAWHCPSCRHVCSCAACRRRSQDEELAAIPLGDMNQRWSRSRDKRERSGSNAHNRDRSISQTKRERRPSNNSTSSGDHHFSNDHTNGDAQNQHNHQNGRNGEYSAAYAPPADSADSGDPVYYEGYPHAANGFSMTNRHMMPGGHMTLRQGGPEGSRIVVPVVTTPVAGSALSPTADYNYPASMAHPGAYLSSSAYVSPLDVASHSATSSLSLASDPFVGPFVSPVHGDGSSGSGTGTGSGVGGSDPNAQFAMHLGALPSPFAQMPSGSPSSGLSAGSTFTSPLAGSSSGASVFDTYSPPYLPPQKPLAQFPPQASPTRMLDGNIVPVPPPLQLPLEQRNGSQNHHNDTSADGYNNLDEGSDARTDGANEVSAPEPRPVFFPSSFSHLYSVQAKLALGQEVKTRAQAAASGNGTANMFARLYEISQLPSVKRNVDSVKQNPSISDVDKVALIAQIVQSHFVSMNPSS